MIKSKIFFILVTLILVLAAYMLSINISKPFWGHHDWNSVVYSNIARNYNRYGYLGTRFGQVTNYDYQNRKNFNYISHYPPLLPILISFTFHLLGQSETSARLTITAFSVFLVFFIYKIGKELKSTFFGIFSALSLILTPIFIYFGKLPVHDTIVPAVSMAGFWAYIKYFKTGNIKYYLFLASTIVFGGLINWSAHYLVIALLFLQFATRTTPKIKRNVLALLPVSIAVFLIQILHVFLTSSKATGSVFSNVLTRVDPYLTAGLYGFSLLKYIKQELLYSKVYYAWPVFLGAAFFIFYLLYKFLYKKRQTDQAEMFLLSLLIYGATQLVVFSQLSFIHDYMIYYLAPFMVLAFSYMIFKILGQIKKSPVFPTVLIAIICIAFLSQLKFTNALIATDTNKRGYLIGQLINKEAPSGTVSFVTSNSYKEFQEVFIGYYSDRNVNYGEELPEDFDKSYSLIIRPKDHDPLNQASKQMLNDKYLRYEDKNFIWYKLEYKKS